MPLLRGTRSFRQTNQLFTLQEYEEVQNDMTWQSTGQKSIVDAQDSSELVNELH